MTFEAIVTRIANHCNLSSPEARTRIGIGVNANNRRVTALCGLGTPIRTVTRTVSTTTLTRTVQFTEIEKIDRIIDATTATSIRPLKERSLDEIQLTQSTDAPPSLWAVHSTTADDITIMMDTAPTAVYSLQATGTATLADLSGNDEPAWPESFHEILVAYGISEEYLRKEKNDQAAIWASFDEKRPGRAENMLSALRMQLADSPSYSTRQNSRA